MENGMYRTKAGDIFKVQVSKTSGYPYAKRLQAISGQRLTELDERVRYEFVYAPGAIQALRPEMRMTEAEAREWGIRTGTCCVCGAFLKDAKSVSLGIGPVCLKGTAWRQGFNPDRDAYAKQLAAHPETCECAVCAKEEAAPVAASA